MTSPRVVVENERTNRWIRQLAGLGLGLVLLLNALVAGEVLWSVNEIRKGSHDGRHHLDCVVGVLFRQDPPGCPGVKAGLIRDGILPPGFPTTTTTTPKGAP